MVICFICGDQVEYDRVRREWRHLTPVHASSDADSEHSSARDHVVMPANDA